MNVLLLSNGAPNYHHFFNQLAKRFSEDGVKVAVAVDSHFSKVKNGLDATGFPVHEFSSYFKKHETDPDLLGRYSEFNLNAALLSDFERAQVYGIWGNKEDDYFDRLKSALLSYFEEIFDLYKIDLVLYENVSNTFAHFAYFVATRRGAAYCGLIGSRLPGRFSITTEPHDMGPGKIFGEIESGKRIVPIEAMEWCKDYLEHFESAVPDYMKINGLGNVNLASRYLRRDRAKAVIGLLRHAGEDAYHSFQIGNPLRTYVNLFRRNVARRMKLGWVKKVYQKPVQGESFLLYPMHFHPESSTSVLAGTYLDEYEVIRNIAFNMPEGRKLYVKDHVSAWGYPSLDFYRRLGKLPNVRVLSPFENTKELIKKSAAIITLTSTVGYEALLLGKRVYLYGSVFYEFHKDVIKIGDPARIFDLFRETLDKEVELDTDYNFRFLASYYLSTESGRFNPMLTGAAAVQAANELYDGSLSALYGRVV